MAFQILMGVFAVISVGMFWICFATTKERWFHPSSLQIYELISGRYSTMVHGSCCSSPLFTLMSVAIRAGGCMYYFKYFVGTGDTPVFWILNQTSVFLSLGTLGMLVGITMTRWLVERFEKRDLLIVLFAPLYRQVSLHSFSCPRKRFGQWSSSMS